jgi:hypothetical protein
MNFEYYRNYYSDTPLVRAAAHRQLSNTRDLILH